MKRNESYWKEQRLQNLFGNFKTPSAMPMKNISEVSFPMDKTVIINHKM
jgi:hypothetical protein